jgi:hypothetical protein
MALVGVDWLGVCLRLQSVQIIGGALRMRGRGEDRALVVLEDFEPVADVAGVILARLRRDGQIGTKKGST